MLFRLVLLFEIGNCPDSSRIELAFIVLYPFEGKIVSANFELLEDFWIELLAWNDVGFFLGSIDDYFIMSPAFVT